SRRIETGAKLMVFRMAGADRPVALSSHYTNPSMAGERDPKSVGDGRFDDADDGHLYTGRPPGSHRHERLGGADEEVRDSADDERRDHRRHADGEEERDDRDEAADRGPHA